MCLVSCVLRLVSCLVCIFNLTSATDAYGTSERRTLGHPQLTWSKDLSRYFCLANYLYILLACALQKETPSLVPCLCRCSKLFKCHTSTGCTRDFGKHDRSVQSEGQPESAELVTGRSSWSHSSDADVFTPCTFFSYPFPYSGTGELRCNDLSSLTKALVSHFVFLISPLGSKDTCTKRTALVTFSRIKGFTLE